MIKYILMIIILLLLSCETGSQIERNTKHTIEWISSSDKPIIVIVQDSITGLGTAYAYTLRNPKNTFYSTGFAELKLPDTIK